MIMVDIDAWAETRARTAGVALAYAREALRSEEACRAEGAVSLRIHVGFEDYRAWSFTMAPTTDAVRRVHERADPLFDEITEVVASTQGDLFVGAVLA